MTYRSALAYVVTPTHEEAGGPSVRTAAERVSPELGQRVRAALSSGGTDDHVRRLDRAQRELVGYGSTPKRPAADVAADLREAADRLDATAQSNAEHHERMGNAEFGESPIAVRQRREAGELRAIADVMDQQATERAAYEAERERRAAAPLDIRPTSRSTAKPTPAKRAEAVAASTPDAPSAAPAAPALSKKQRDMGERFDKLAGEHASDKYVAMWRQRAIDLAGEMEQVGGGALGAREADSIRDQMASVQDGFTHAMAGAQAAAAVRNAGGDDRAQRIANSRATLDSRARKAEQELAHLERQIKDYTGETRKILRNRINDAKAEVKKYRDRIERVERDHDTKLIYDADGKLSHLSYEPPAAPAVAPSINDMMAANMAASVANPSTFGAAHGRVVASATDPGVAKGQRLQHGGTSWEVLEKPRRARPDARGNAGWLFRVRREDQGIESTMRLNDGKSAALAEPK
jgi:hypothetical protein